LEALRVRLADLAERLAAHGRHLLLGVLERDESDAPARMLAVLAVMGRTISEIDVIAACCPLPEREPEPSRSGPRPRRPQRGAPFRGQKPRDRVRRALPLAHGPRACARHPPRRCL